MNTEQLQEAVHVLESQGLEKVEHVQDLEELDACRVAFLGRRGHLTQLLRSLSRVPLEDRPYLGSLANQAKARLEEAFVQRGAAIKQDHITRMAGEERLDVTLPGRPLPTGRLHPTTRIVRETCDAFIGMGFQVMEGPEVEWDYYNFEALNIPQHHPARDMWNTFWVDYRNQEGANNMLLRTHTSPMQIRLMERMDPPIRVVVPGKCYRYEATDATHESQFYQVEGLAVGSGITFAHLKGTLYEFARRLFGPERRVRFRCDYFPFVEPGVEMAIDCFQCKGQGCLVCKETGWIEIMGAGMIHPNVLKQVGYDSSVYNGFAFGLGCERIAMLKWGVDDIRLFYNNDIRFLSQF